MSLANAIHTDFRSDTLTKPCEGMRRAMADAELGDDVYGEDPTVNRLEGVMADMLGKEAALFASSGTQSNLLGMLAHCARGEEIIVGAPYHTYVYEAAGASVLGGIALCPVPVEDGRHVSPDTLRTACKDGDFHHPITRLVNFENTVSGRVIPLKTLRKTESAARDLGLSTHLDGARFFNATVALGCSAADLAAPFDTVSICLSKGLGAPVGSVLVGPRALIDKARRLRKMLGGGMRQAGVLAAAGLYALEHNIARLAEDHARAEALATQLRHVEAGEVTQDTNMVFLHLPEAQRQPFCAHMRAAGIETGGPYDTLRLVLHRDITDQNMVHTHAAIEAFFADK